jgi:hypothetical protein
VLLNRPSKCGSNTECRSIIGRLEHEPADSVAFEIQWLEGSLEDPILQERVQLLKAEYLMQTGDRDQALEILRLVEVRRNHAPASERAANRLKELQGNN